MSEFATLTGVESCYGRHVIIKVVVNEKRK